MTDYSKIDWSKLPELPGGLRCRLLVNELQVLKNGYVNAKRLDHDGSEWRFHCELRRHLEMAFAATDIIDRFIAEQEAELAKPKSRRLTPKELLVELIQTGKTVSLVRANEGPITLRWSEQGLYGSWSTGHHSLVDMRWLLRHDSLEVTDLQVEPPKPRLLVKTKAPEGYAWEFDRHGNVVLRKAGTESTWGLVERSIREDIRGRAIREIAIVGASEELNP